MISNQQKERLEYFVDKIVSFIVPATSKRFEDNDIIQYFVGRVTASQKKNLFPMKSQNRKKKLPICLKLWTC
jgi:hypothetical protein